MFTQVDHVGVVVEDLETALALYGEVYAMDAVCRETVEAQGVEAVLLAVGEGYVELLRPLADDTPVGRFLAHRGPGLHHVAFRVPDVRATLGRLRTAGLRLVDEAPRAGLAGSRVAFLHPASTGGVLTEIVQVSGGASNPWPSSA